MAKFGKQLRDGYTVHAAARGVRPCARLVASGDALTKKNHDLHGRASDDSFRTSAPQGREDWRASFLTPTQDHSLPFISAQPAKMNKPNTPGDSADISNIGKLIIQLQAYPPEARLDSVNIDLLRVLCRQLRTIIAKSTARPNNTKIHAIKECSVDEEVSKQFDCWRKDPKTFWELSLAALPQYSTLGGSQEKLRAFFLGALHLNKQNKIRRVHYRFVTIAANELFRRQNGSANITEEVVRAYLQNLSLPASDDDVTRFINILTGGRRRKQFCRDIQTAARDRANQVACADTNSGNTTAQTKKEEPVDYGPMFIDAIPDDMYVAVSLHKHVTYQKIAGTIETDSSRTRPRAVLIISCRSKLTLGRTSLAAEMLPVRYSSSIKD